jgi:hypothetical protein
MTADRVSRIWNLAVEIESREKRVKRPDKCPEIRRLKLEFFQNLHKTESLVLQAAKIKPLAS